MKKKDYHRSKETKETWWPYAMWNPGDNPGTEKHLSGKTSEIWMKSVV